MRTVNADTREEILRKILAIYPDKTIELDFKTPFQLLMAVMLSAQMTDKGVNKATPELFSKVQEPKDMLILTRGEVAQMIRSVNYWNTKAKHIYMTAEMLNDLYSGNIPDTLEEIIKLPGVGVKTGKVVLSHLYNKPYIGVDTHIHRVMNRMSIVKTKTPEETDKKLEQLLTDEQKSTMHHAIVLFGRYICTARDCKCNETALFKFCHCEQCQKKKLSLN